MRQDTDPVQGAGERGEVRRASVGALRDGDKILGLIRQVGKKYQYEMDGMALGCMAPVYFLYPDLPRYPWPEDDLGGYITDLFKRHGQQIEADDMQPGDLVLIRWPMGLVHPAVYLGDDKYLHSRESSGWEVVSRRHIRAIEGVYRYAGRDGVL